MCNEKKKKKKKKHLVRCLGPDGLLNHPASEEASGALFQHAPEGEGGGFDPDGSKGASALSTPYWVAT